MQKKTKGEYTGFIPNQEEAELIDVLANRLIRELIKFMDVDAFESKYQMLMAYAGLCQSMAFIGVIMSSDGRYEQFAEGTKMSILNNIRIKKETYDKIKEVLERDEPVKGYGL